MSSFANKTTFFLFILCTIMFSFSNDETLEKSTIEVVGRINSQVPSKVLNISIDHDSNGKISINNIQLEDGTILSGEELQEVMSALSNDMRTDPPGV